MLMIGIELLERVATDPFFARQTMDASCSDNPISYNDEIGSIVNRESSIRTVEGRVWFSEHAQSFPMYTNKRIVK